MKRTGAISKRKLKQKNSSKQKARIQRRCPIRCGSVTQQFPEWSLHRTTLVSSDLVATLNGSQWTVVSLKVGVQVGFSDDSSIKSIKKLAFSKSEAPENNRPGKFPETIVFTCCGHFSEAGTRCTASVSGRVSNARCQESWPPLTCSSWSARASRECAPARVFPE